MSGKKPEEPPDRSTQVGYGIPHVPKTGHRGADGWAEAGAAEHPRAPSLLPLPPNESQVGAGGGGMQPVRTGPPPIEIEYIRESNVQAAREAPSALLEIWTRNRVYHVDVTMTCVGVVDRATGQLEANNSLLGARLTGGQRRSRAANAVEIVFPLPVPGTEATFKRDGRRQGQYGHTSTIERVVLRVRKIRIGAAESEPLWDEITGRFQVR